MGTLILVPDGDPFAVNLLVYYGIQATEIAWRAKNFSVSMP